MKDLEIIDRDWDNPLTLCVCPGCGTAGYDQFKFPTREENKFLITCRGCGNNWFETYDQEGKLVKKTEVDPTGYYLRRPEHRLHPHMGKVLKGRGEYFE